MSKAHRLLYHSTLGSKVIGRRVPPRPAAAPVAWPPPHAPTPDSPSPLQYLLPLCIWYRRVIEISKGVNTCWYIFEVYYPGEFIVCGCLDTVDCRWLAAGREAQHLRGPPR